jgi:ABC-2 type transport system permease protein
VAGAGFYLFVMAVVGLCLGTIIRHTAGAIAAIGVIFIEPLFVLTGFPAWLKDSVLWWAGQAVMSSRPRPGYPSASLGFIVCGVYAVLALAVATFVITRRDA